MSKALLAAVAGLAVLAASLVPPGRPVMAASPGFGSAVSALSRPTWQTDASVNAIAVAGDTVFAGGLFTRIRPPGRKPGEEERVRTYLAAFDRTTGAPQPFAPALDGPVWSMAASPNGRWLAVGGDFTTVSGQRRARIALFNVATGRLVADWDPAVSYRVSALAIWGGTVYLGGSFGQVDRQERDRLAAVTLGSGVLRAWNPGADDDVYAIDLADDGSRVFVGGGFTEVAGESHHALAMLHPVSGAAYPMPAAAAIPELTPECDSRVKDIDTLGRKVFVGNAGHGSGCYDGLLAADAVTGKLLWQNKCLGATEAVQAIGSWVYKGSHAHDCRQAGGFGPGTGIHHLLVLSGITGKLGPWYPNTNADGTTLVGPLAFASGGNDIWAGGDFTTVNGRPQQGLTRFTNQPGGAQPGKPAAPKLSSSRSGKVVVRFQTTLDPDNLTLTYTLYRGRTKIGRWSRTSYSWKKPVITTFTDSGLSSGQTVAYQVAVSDGHSTRRSTAATIRVR